LKVEDSNGKVLEENEPKKGNRVLSEGEAFLIDDILSDNKARSVIFGTNSLLNVPGWQIAVKTGTTNDKRDNWTIGGNQHAIVGVWVGNNDNSPMKEVASGVSGASPIWRRILLEALASKPRIRFDAPGSVVQAEVDQVSGYKSHDSYPSRMEYFIKGTEPGEDQVHLKLKVCKSDGKLATPGDISSGNFEEKEYFRFKEEDPTASGGANAWQKGILDWISTQNDSRYHPPSDYCGGTNPVFVDFDKPSDQQSQLNNNVDIVIKASSTADIEKVELEIDGVNKRNFSGGPYTYTASLTDGIHTIKAIATDVSGNRREKTITVGVHSEWNATPSPTATPAPSPTP
jgi:hypothetical protein